MVHGLGCPGIWDFPKPGIEPVALALAGGFFTTEPPGKPHKQFEFLFPKNIPRLPLSSIKDVLETCI